MIINGLTKILILNYSFANWCPLLPYALLISDWTERQDINLFPWGKLSKPLEHWIFSIYTFLKTWKYRTHCFEFWCTCQFRPTFKSTDSQDSNRFCRPGAHPNVMNKSNWWKWRERMFYESMSPIWKNNIFGRNNKIKHYFYYFVYLLHCCLHVQGLFLTWNLNLGCLLAVFQALPLLLRAWPGE